MQDYHQPTSDAESIFGRCLESLYARVIERTIAGSQKAHQQQLRSSGFPDVAYSLHAVFRCIKQLFETDDFDRPALRSRRRRTSGNPVIVAQPEFVIVRAIDLSAAITRLSQPLKNGYCRPANAMEVDFDRRPISNSSGDEIRLILGSTDFDTTQDIARTAVGTGRNSEQFAFAGSNESPESTFVFLPGKGRVKKHAPQHDELARFRPRSSLATRRVSRAEPAR